MHVDWVTVAAQLVNFLILVFLLKRFLYARVIAAMDRRQAGISEQLEQASRREQAAQQLQEDFQQRLDEFERTRSQALARSEREAQAQRTVLIAAIRDEVTHTRAQWQQTLEAERERFLVALSAQSVRLTFELAKRALQDLADETLEQRIIDRFIADLQKVNPERRELIRAGVAPVLIYTAFALDDTARTRIRAALAPITGASVGTEFRQRAEIGCGIELVAGQARAGWSVQSHLAQLEREAGDALTRAFRPVAGDSRT